jgi:hypothetical protein
MAWWAVSLIAVGALPVLLACWRNRRTSLIHALGWGIMAWLAWLISAAAGTILARYLALCLTACAGVAVLGARRPGAAAWHAVVAGLLAVLLIAPAQGLLAGVPLPIDSIRTGFLAVALLVGLVNYLPTSFGLGALALLAACILELRHIGSNMPENERLASLALTGSAPWLAWLGRRVWSSRGGEPDRIWKDIRDRFGVVWGERIREQFNRAASNAGLEVMMGWGGLRRFDRAPLTENERTVSRDLLTALMKRFGTGD